MTDWIKNLKDNISVAELSIPGTHDAAAFKRQDVTCSGVPLIGWIVNCCAKQGWRTQHASFKEQLEYGVRYFDIRIRYNPTDERKKGEIFHLFHDYAYLGSPDDAVLEFKRFLDKYKSEFLILQIQQESSSLNSEEFGKAIKKYFSEFNLSIFNYKGVIPTVGQLRGKAWFIQAAHVKMNELQIDTDEPIRNIIETEKYVLQNFWETKSQEEKREAYRNLLKKQKRPDRLKINYISGGFGPYGVNNGIFMEDIKHFEHLGISVVDFVTPQIAQRVFEKNFKQKGEIQEQSSKVKL